MNNSKLYIGNIAYTVTTDMLRKLFEEVGKVIDAIVLTDRESGRSRGFGFVEMSTPEEAKAAIEKFQEHEFEGRKLIVNLAKPREDR
ncbi:MAG: RNA-binding protein [bacterium]|nr:RNA-binding protein [bacterium]